MVTGITVVILAWFAVWLVPQLTSGFITGLANGNSGPQGPLESWRNDRVFGLAAGLALGICPVGAFAFGLMTGLTVGLTYGITSSATWSTALAWRLQLQRAQGLNSSSKTAVHEASYASSELPISSGTPSCKTI